MMDEQLAAYRAARSGAAFTDVSAWGWLRLTGRDRLELLHRLSTNDLKKLNSGQGAATVLTSPTGRVMAFLTVHAGEEDVFLRTMPGQAEDVTRYLKSMIFWQDQVEVVDLTADVAQLALYGLESGAALRALSAEDISGLSPYGWRVTTIAGIRVSVYRGGPLEAFQWSLVAPPDARQPVLAALSSVMPQLDAETVDLLRIEAGLPLWGRELSDRVTPLETGLLPAISFNKGCYTGQEVIARQTNYDKVTRNLVGLEFAQGETRFRAASLLGETRFLNARVLGPGRGGFVGSMAYSPTLDKTIALAVVPRELAQAGAEVEVVFGDQTLKATVRSLPFREQQ